MKSEKKFTANEIYVFAFGLFLGLCIWKFGNPVILDQVIYPPETFSDFLHNSWPTHWANWLFLPFAIVGIILILKNKPKWPTTKLLWLLPLFWLGWQFLSASQTVDANLTATTLFQFFGCVTCYFLGAMLFTNQRVINILLIGILAAFTFCLIRAIDQRVFEYPQSRQMIAEGEQTGWTNLPPEVFLQMKHDGIIINTNGADVINPVITAKLEKNRVNGTLVYANALAGIILMLFPISIALAFKSGRLRPTIRFLVITLLLLLGSLAFFWSGSKFGWLIAVLMSGACLLRLKWSLKLKAFTIAAVIIVGLGIFAARFHNYFSNGATSATARFDYWRAAVQITKEHPLFGTGPGTFQRPYSAIKLPDSEMARLTHNDYLEQFSDSGIIGGITYASWILYAMAILGRRIWQSGSLFSFAIYLGLLGWFLQQSGEFGLYIPALSWTAFTLLGSLLGISSIPFDKKTAGD